MKEKKLVNKTPTGRQGPTKNWRFNYWTKLLDRYSLKIELKFSADLRFAAFFKFANPINLLQKSVIRKPIYPYLLDELLKPLKTLRQKHFGGLLILDSPWHAGSFADFRKLKWVSIGQIFNNVHAQKKTAPEVPCGLNSVEKYFPEVGSFSGVIRVHEVIFSQIQWKRWRVQEKKVTESSLYF